MDSLTAKDDTPQPVVVCLAAGLSQKPVIERAKTLGFFIIGVDRDPQAAAGHLCDHMIHLSTHDAEPLIHALKSSPYFDRLCGVLNRSSGPPVVTTAAINEAFSLPGVPVPRARQCLNKDLMRNECLKREVSVVQHQVIRKFSELSVTETLLPCVIKPALSMVGKMGVVVVQKSEQLAMAFDAAQAASVTGKVLVEDYLPGFDISVIAFVNRGKPEILAILDEINQKHEDGRVSGRAMAVPSKFSTGPESEKIAELVRQVAGVFELYHTPLMLSCRITEGGQPKLMEIHLDLGGDKILDVLLPEAGKFDALQHMIQALAGVHEWDCVPSWNPTAVVFDQGAGLITNRTHRIFHASDREDLDQLLINALGKVPRP